MSSLPIAKVEPLTTARSLRGPFDYRIPSRLDGVGVGTLLQIPFGAQRLLGVVTEMAETSELDPERLAEPLGALDSVISPELVELGLWVGHEYCSTPARGLELVLPPGTGASSLGTAPKLELVVRLTDAARETLESGLPRLGAKQLATLKTLDERGGEAGAATLREHAGATRATIRSLEKRGLVEAGEVEVSRRPVEISVGATGRRD